MYYVGLFRFSSRRILFRYVANGQTVLYLGRETLRYFSDCWANLAKEYSEKGAKATELDRKLTLISYSQEYRAKSIAIDGLASHAKSKPQLFRHEPYALGQRLTWFVTNPPERFPAELTQPNSFVEVAIVGFSEKDSKRHYVVSIRDQCLKNICFERFMIPFDCPFIIPIDDFHYLRVHPNFFRLYLGVRVSTDEQLRIIENVLSAL